MSCFAITATPIYRIEELKESLENISKTLSLDYLDQTEDYRRAKSIIQLNSWCRGDATLIEQTTLLFLFWNAKANSLESFNEEVKKHRKHLGSMVRRFPLQMEALYKEFNK